MRTTLLAALTALGLLAGCHDAAAPAASIEPTLRSVTHRAALALGRDIEGVELWTHTQGCQLPDGTRGVYMIMDWNAGRDAGITHDDIDGLGASLGATRSEITAIPAAGAYRREFLLRAGDLDLLLIANLDPSGNFGLSSKSSCVPSRP